MNDKVKELARTLEIDVDDINAEIKKNEWYEIELYQDVVDNRYYLVLDNAEYYYNGDMYGIEHMEKIESDMYYIYEVI